MRLPLKALAHRIRELQMEEQSWMVRSVLRNILQLRRIGKNRNRFVNSRFDPAGVAEIISG
jgi:hypothetical protein